MIPFRRLSAAALTLALLAGPAAAAGPCAEDRVDLRGARGQARFSVEVADDAAERATGLMHRVTMPQSHGMLFVYPEAQPVSFWMENTLIPLDMIFIGADGVVRRVAANARPLDRTPIPSGEAVQFVLEINGGLAARLGIGPGNEVRHPRITGGAVAWPCE